MVTKGIIYLATDTFPEITIECTYSLLPASMYRHWQHWTDVYAEVVVEFSFANSIWEYIYCLTWGISDNHLTIRLCRDSLVSTRIACDRLSMMLSLAQCEEFVCQNHTPQGILDYPEPHSPTSPHTRTSKLWSRKHHTPPSKNWACSWMTLKLQSRIAPPPNWDVSWRTFCNGLVCRDYPRGYLSFNGVISVDLKVIWGRP